MSAENGTTKGEKGITKHRSATPDPTAPALTPRHVKPIHRLRRPSRSVPLHQRGAHHVGVGYEEVTKRRTPDINTETNRVGVGRYAPPVSVAPHLPRPPPCAQYLHVSGNSPRRFDATSGPPTICDGRRAQYPHINEEPTTLVWGYEEVTRQRTPDINMETNHVGVGAQSASRQSCPPLATTAATRPVPPRLRELTAGVGWLWGGDETVHLPTVSDDGRRAQYPHIDKEPTMQVSGVGRSNKNVSTAPDDERSPTSVRKPTAPV
ncbi:hypothetical protein GALMADRAFT_237623 [Galerina marginata CBS 339.88]|uniref:Uncharacterized protein n=1 Tax=Galerina marginata (strain CBS 339.88) TaxID=685588 RepID=A0A067TGT8_GALM3|nr:hypothetical protein GALMADRAFT_237623 [Galerina marginata CBS 339.88]